MQKSHEIIFRICLQRYELFSDERDIGGNYRDDSGGSGRAPSPSEGKSEKETASFYHSIPVNRAVLRVEAPTKPKEWNAIGSLEQPRDLHMGRAPVTS